MSEEVVLQNGRGKGTAVYGRKRPFGTSTVRMNGARYKFLARPAGAGNEHVSRGGRDPANCSINFQHLRTSSDNRRLRGKAVLRRVAACLLRPRRLSQQREQVIDQKRFAQGFKCSSGY